MSSKDVKEDLRLALDESTSEKALHKIWGTSRSVKVRKAVASNPNAGPKLLREAARLYLEEVLGNPGFAMLELFDDDPWLMRVSAAYNDPWDFLIVQRNSIGYSRALPNDHFGWAVLLSPKLEAECLDRCLQFMSKAAFRRAVKNPRILEKVRDLYHQALKSTKTWPFSVESIITLSNEKVIGLEDVFLGLSNYGQGSVSAPKSVFIKYLKNLHEVYISDASRKDFIPRLLGKLLLVSRSHTMQWIWNSFTNDEILCYAGELYAAAMQHMVNAVGSKITLVHDNLRAVGSIVTQFLKAKFISRDSATAQSFTDAYNFVKAYGLETQKFSRFGLMLSDRTYLAELDKCDITVKEFFCKAGCLGNWASATGSDVKYKILNEVNDYVHSKNGVDPQLLLFDKCSVRKVVSISEDTYIF